MDVVVTCTAVKLDERTGEWCDDCALPSIVESDWAVVVADTLYPISRLTLRVCTDCGAMASRQRY